MRNKTDEGFREKILKESVRLFSEKGYHGTSMRDIASSSECSLPTLYYYYKNKVDLFYEVAYKEFVLLIERLNAQVIIGATIQETYFNAIKQRKELLSYDKAVYKLSLKVWLGFDGESKVRKDLIEWENGRVERTKKILETYVENKKILPDFSNLFVRVMENVIEKIILLDEEITDEDIKNEIELLMKLLSL
jgi:AcrR family transcriptional regulator